MLLDQVRAKISENCDEMLDTLAGLIAIPSVAEEPDMESSTPYGLPCAVALDTMLHELEKIGMTTKCYAHHVGVADWDNKLEEHLGIMCHLDVVPAVEKDWQTNPFHAVIQDGRIYGRGAIDDKGPAVCVLYALKAIRDAGIKLNRNVRFLLGCNEENGSSDIDYYLEKDHMPPLVFTPDANYPLINLEKGMLRLKFTKETADDIASLQAGTVPNAVPSEAVVVLKKALTETLPEYMKQEQEQLICIGEAAHASTPDLGKNAITELVAFLGKFAGFGDCLALSKLFPVGKNHGEGLGIYCQDDESGELTCVLSMLTVERGRIEGCIDIRYPICTTKENLLEQIETALNQYGFALEPVIISDPHYVAPDQPLVKALLEVYEEETGEKGTCIAIGGGTYVHDIPGGVAFGMEQPGWDYHMHGNDEFIPLDQLLKNTEIMAAAILKLCYDGEEQA